MIIIGCGYVGQRLATRLMADGQSVSCLVRSESSAATLRDQQLGTILADLDAADLPQLPTTAEQLFYLAPPPGEGREDLRMQNFLAATTGSGEPKRIVYMSTTGVYGDCGGDWVDETRPVQLTTDRAHRRWDAEEQLRSWRERTNGELLVLRVAGIYGPGRLPLERLRKGIPMVREEDASWSNRIQVDDLVEVCVAAMERGVDGEIYNVSDGNPSTMTDYFCRVADLTGLPRPRELTLEQARGFLSPGLLSYLSESRRLDNRKLREELGVSLRFPTLAEGLPASLDESEAEE